jgi:hypothetical protein
MRIKWRFIKGCGKKRYESSLDAQLMMLRIMRRRRDRPTEKTEIRHYRCSRCDGWHLTSQRLATSTPGR